MQNAINELLDSANHILLGKQRQVRLAVCCLLARGHLLIEDIPGVGKTTLAYTLAKLLGLCDRYAGMFKFPMLPMIFIPEFDPPVIRS